MASEALNDWRSDRTARIDELFAAHQRIGGTGAGRRTDTEQINWALVLRLAGEFQGFVRDLYALGVTRFADETAPNNTQLRSVVTTLLTQGLKLDSGNANPGSIGDAFNRFGLRWWPALELHDERSAGRQLKLERLNRARNAIAHGRLNELHALRTEGSPLTLRRSAIGAPRSTASLSQWIVNLPSTSQRFLG